MTHTVDMSHNVWKAQPVGLCGFVHMRQARSYLGAVNQIV